jgi:hypothetical protein
MLRAMRHLYLTDPDRSITRRIEFENFQRGQDRLHGRDSAIATAIQSKHPIRLPSFSNWHDQSQSFRPAELRVV